MSIVDQTLQSIEGIVKDYREWTTGKTRNPEKSREINGSPREWHCWDAGIPLAAHVIETYLVAKGMKTGPYQDGTFVYIFRSQERQK